MAKNVKKIKKKSKWQKFHENLDLQEKEENLLILQSLELEGLKLEIPLLFPSGQTRNANPHRKG